MQPYRVVDAGLDRPAVSHRFGITAASGPGSVAEIKGRKGASKAVQNRSLSAANKQSKQMKKDLQ